MRFPTAFILGLTIISLGFEALLAVDSICATIERCSARPSAPAPVPAPPGLPDGLYIIPIPPQAEPPLPTWPTPPQKQKYKL